MLKGSSVYTRQLVVLLSVFALVSVFFVAEAAAQASFQIDGQTYELTGELQPMEMEIDYHAICSLPVVDHSHPSHVVPDELEDAPGREVDQEATADFDVTYLGFDGEEGQQAREAFDRALGIWETHVATNVTVTVEVEFDEFEEERVLASAGPGRFYSGEVTTPEGDREEVFFPVPLINQLANQDLEAGRDDPVAHIRVFINQDINWYYGTGQPGSGQFDFVSVITHEIAHGLGFIGSMAVPDDEDVGLYPFNRQNQQEFGIPLVYDLFAEDGDADGLTNESVYPNPSNALYRALTGREGGVFFDGPQTLRGNVFEPARLYAPREWNQGSSYSHLDEQTYPSGDVNSLMTPRIARQEVIQTPGSITCGMFSDMGWEMGPDCLRLLDIDLIAFNAEVDEANPDRIQVEWTIDADAPVDRFVIEQDYQDAPPPERGFREVATVDFDDYLEEGDDFRSYQHVFEDLPPGRHVFRLKVQETDGSTYFSNEEEVIVPAEEAITIRGPYPHPVQDQTRLDVIAERSGPVTMRVFDASGREVIRRAAEVSANRPRTFEIDASNLSSGVYFARFSGDGIERTARFVVVR